MRSTWLLAVIGGGCSGVSLFDALPVATTAHQVRVNGTGTTTYVSVDILATADGGEPIACSQGALDVDVRVSLDGGRRWVQMREGSVTVRCGDASPPDIAVLIDNSGSQEAIEAATREGAEGLVDGVIGLGGRASMVRVSTFSRVLQDLTGEAAALEEALPELTVNGGWTALYDGVRMANETLGRALARTETPRWSSLAEFCDDYRPRGVVAFTNGEDNNSAEERLAGPDGDGYATTVDDISRLHVDGVTTPIHVIGVGPRVDESGLSAIAEASGGRAVIAPDTAAIPDAFDVVTSWLDASAHVCAEIPTRGCGPALVEVSWTWQTADGPLSGVVQRDVHVTCPVDGPTGAAATVLLTLSDPEIPAASASTLAANAVAWTSPVAAPRVLVVRDDGHHGEDMEDSTIIADWLLDAGYAVTFIEEPPGGLLEADVSAYDVIWFSNPGWPMDSLTSFETLRRAAALGRGVVLQGDDMSWSLGSAFSLAPLTHLQHQDNGTSTCGRCTDNRGGDRFDVALQANGHPIGAGVAEGAWRYGNDIDASVGLGEGEQVLAEASLVSGDCVARRPAVVAWEP